MDQYTQLETLEKFWQAWILRENSSKMDANKIYKNLILHYSESHRAYHNLTHIGALLTWFEQSKAHLEQPALVVAAIFFHDIVYNVRSKDNEFQSAQMAREHLQQLGWNTAETERVGQWIEATAQHMQAEARGDLAYFLDMDLSILGVSAQIYSQYAQAIRQEYAHIPSFFYRRGRSKVLNTFLEHSPLFRTPYFYERLETQARENLAQELTRL